MLIKLLQQQYALRKKLVQSKKNKNSVAANCSLALGYVMLLYCSWFVHGIHNIHLLIYLALIFAFLLIYTEIDRQRFIERATKACVLIQFPTRYLDSSSSLNFWVAIKSWPLLKTEKRWTK